MLLAIEKLSETACNKSNSDEESTTHFASASIAPALIKYAQDK